MNPVLHVKTLSDVNNAFSGVDMAAQGINTIFTDLAYQTNFITEFGINNLIQIF